MRIAVVLGSTSDLRAFDKVDVLELVGVMDVEVTLDIISAHRNSDVLKRFCSNLTQEVPTIAIVGAGMAAALAGAMSAELKHVVPVIGVPLPSTGFENSMDAFLAMWRMPPGVTVSVVCGFKNAIIAALEMLVVGDNDAANILSTHLITMGKKPQHQVPLDPAEREG
ncbi:5-(carboxyamino)imidazole ribonucleotide mutase [archaeon]|nr:5-(carboxyamino)imidazole ribonucleotide mutase [archaeon]